MASVNNGTTILWGTGTMTGYIVEETRENEQTDVVTVQDEDGQNVVEVTNFNVRTDIDLTVVVKSGTTLPSVGDEVTFTSKVNGSTTMSLKGIEITSSNKDVTRVSMQGTTYPDITLGV